MKINKITAIVLAGGSGKRMGGDIPKQYLQLGGKPILYYSLIAFEESKVDEIILVVSKNDIEYCKNTIINQYGFKKVVAVVEGGVQRYDSVYNGLKKISDAQYVLIHDGARPFITPEIIKDTINALKKTDACVVGVPVKDTVKLIDNCGTVVKTPNRDFVWTVQTPQAFEFKLILQAYSMIMEEMVHNDGAELNITDDAMVLEHTLKYPVKMVMGSYRNIKITTPEDLLIGEAFLKNV